MIHRTGRKAGCTGRDIGSLVHLMVEDCGMLLFSNCFHCLREIEKKVISGQ